MSQTVTVMRRTKQRLKRSQTGRDARRAEDAVDDDELDLLESLSDPLANVKIQPPPADDDGEPSDGPGDPLDNAALRDDIGGPDLPGDPSDEEALKNPGVPSGGKRLPDDLRAAFEQVFARSLEQVRVHQGGDAAERAASIGAEAYTVGQHIVLGSVLHGAALERILAHELTHVIQGQEGRIPRGQDVVDDNHPIEREAYANEGRVVRELQDAKRMVATGTVDADVADAPLAQDDPRSKLQRTLPTVLGKVDAALAIWADLSTDASGQVDPLGRELRALVSELAQTVQQWGAPLLAQSSDPTTAFAWAEALVGELSKVVPELAPVLEAVADASLLDVLIGGQRAVSAALADASWDVPELGTTPLDRQVDRGPTPLGNVFDDDPTRAAATEQALDDMSRVLGDQVGDIEVHADALGKQRAGEKGAIGLMDQGVVYLDPAFYDPTTMPGIELLAHEVAHVVQAGNPVVDDPRAGQLAEAEADTFAAQFASGATPGAVEMGLPVGHIAAKGGPGQVRIEDSVSGTEVANAQSMIDNNEADCDCGPNPFGEGVHEEKEEPVGPGNKSDETEPTSTDVAPPDPIQSKGSDLGAGEPSTDGGDVSEVDDLVGTIEELPTETLAPPPTQEDFASRLDAARGILATVADGSTLAGAVPSLLAPTFDLSGDEEADAQSKADATSWQAQSQSALSGFLASRGSALADFCTIQGDIESKLEAAGNAAREQVLAAMATQTEAITAHTETMRSQLIAEVDVLKSTIHGVFDATVTSVEGTTSSGHAWNEGLLATNTSLMADMLTAQHTLIRGLHGDAHRDMLAAGEEAARQAIRDAEGVAQRHERAARPKTMDSILDGYLTYRRHMARAKAARAVGEGYAAEIRSSAREKADEALRTETADLESATILHDNTKGELEAAVLTTTGQLETEKTAALTATEKARKAMLDIADDILQAGMTGFDQHLVDQHKKVEETGTQVLEALEAAKGMALLANTELAANTAKGLSDAFVAMAAALNGSEAPDPAELQAALSQAAAQIDAKLAEVTALIHAGLDEASAGLLKGASKAEEGLATLAQKANDTCTDAMAALTEQIGTVSNEAWTASSKISTDHSTKMTETMNAATVAYQGHVDGLEDGFKTAEDELRAGAEDRLRTLTEGFNDTVKNKMPPAIAEEARKAAAREQPAWKTALKWVAIIVIVVVCAFVLGPFIVGAVGGALAAAGMGTAMAAFLGAVIGGAIVGAISGALVQLVSNLHDGKDLTDGLLDSIWKGAALGALGGGVGKLAEIFIKSGVAQLATTVVFDAASDTVWNMAVLGQEFSWESFAIATLTSVVMNGAGKFAPTKPKVDGMEGVGARFGSRGRLNEAPDINSGNWRIRADVDAPGPASNTPDGPNTTTSTDGPNARVDSDTPGVRTDADTPGPRTDADGPRTDADGPRTDADDAGVRTNDPESGPETTAPPKAGDEARFHDEFMAAKNTGYGGKETTFQNMRAKGRQFDPQSRRWVKPDSDAQWESFLRAREAGYDKRFTEFRKADRLSRN